MRRLAIATSLCLIATLPLQAAITGTLINADGQPVAGAKVSIYPLELPDAAVARLISASPERTPIASSTSDSKGKFSLPSPKEPVVTLSILAPNYAPIGMEAERDDELGALLLTSAPAKQARITANGKPVAGAKVILRARSVDFVATTDAEGRYNAPDPAKWTTMLVVVHPDFATVKKFSGGPGNRLQPDQKLDPGAAISGRVLAEDGKTPVAGATLAIADVPVGKSGENGEFTIDHASKTWETIEARIGNLAGTFARKGNAPAVVKLAKASTVHGTLRDMKTLAPIAGGRILVSTPRRYMSATAGAITDAKGSFALTLPAGHYEMVASRPGYGVASTDVNVAAGAEATKNLVAVQLARITGSVVDENKSGVSGTRIEAGAVASEPSMRMGRMRMSDPQYSVAGPDGTFVLRADPDVDMQVEAKKKGYPEARTATMRLAPGERKGGVVLTIPTGIAVTGRVVDKNGKPVSDAAIYATEVKGGGGNFVRRFMRSDAGESDNVVKTAADGTFITRLKAGTYSIRVRREGFATKTIPPQTIGASPQPIEVTLEPGVALAGRVTRGGNGIPDIDVQLFGEDGDNGNTKTGPDGSFRIEGLAPGQAMMSVSNNEQGVQQFRPVTIPADNLVIDVPVGGTVSGRVVDKESHNPVTDFDAGYSNARGGAGMMIMGGGVTKHFTSDDGTFTLEHVPPGATNITISAAGYTEGRAQNINVEDGKRIADVEVQLEHGARVTGRVTGPDGSALSGVSVMAGQSGARRFGYGGGGAAITDASGEYSMENVEPGDKTFTFERNGFLTAQKNATISGSDARVDVQMSTGMRISGVVVNDAGTPMADAGVTATSPSDSAFGGRSTRTDSNGQFTMDDLAPGRYSFRASKTGYAPASLNDFDISAGAPVRLVVQTGGTITGHITGLSADEISRAGVVAQLGYVNVSGAVDASGNYRIEGAPAGTVRVYGTVGSGMAARMTTPKSVTVDAGGSAQVDLEFASGTVTGRVTRDGKPSAQAMVMFVPARGSTGGTTVRTSTDSDGNYTAAGLSDASYTVQVIDLAGGTPYQTSYDVHGSNTFNIDIKSAPVRGRVLDASTNKPIDDATLTIRAAGDSAMRFGLRNIATDASGSFVLDSVPAGSYTLSAEKEGYGVKVVDVTVGESGASVDIQLTPNAGIQLRVVDARDGRSISAYVRVSDMSNKLVYESPYRFSSGGTDLTSVPLDAGTYRVTVVASGYATRTLTMMSPSTQTVALTPGGSIAIKSGGSAMRRGRLIGADGREYIRGFGFSSSFVVDPSPGTTLIENILPGTYTLQILGDGDAVVGSAPVTVIEGQVAQVSI